LFASSTPPTAGEARSTGTSSPKRWIWARRSGPRSAFSACGALRPPGELKSRSDRQHTFATLDEVQHALETLAERIEPLATRLPRRLGQKELRWAHLLSGELQDVEDVDRPVAPGPKDVRIAELEDRVAELEACVAEIRADLGLT